MLASVDWLKEHLSDSDLVLLDVRPKTMFLYGHLPKAQSVSIQQVISVDEFGSHLVADVQQITKLFSSLGIDETKTVVIIGDGMDSSSARIAWTLLYFGHHNTMLLDANASELSRYGFPLIRQNHANTQTVFTPKINSDIHIDCDTLKDRLDGGDNLQVLDARTLQEYMAGHLPRSKLIPFTEGIDSTGKRLFVDKASLQTIFLQDNNVSQDKEIVCYCMHGHRASSLFLQLRIAGFQKIRLFDGSFVQWSGKRFPLD